MTVEAFTADLAAVRITDDPDGWALAAYRLAVASSEMASRPEDLVEAIDLLERAGRILTAERAPLEHGRILTAAGSCHRVSGRPDLALPLFEEAAELLVERAPEAERVAALVNVGLAMAEAGRPADGVAPLDEAVRVLEGLGGGGGSGDDETTRLLGAALLNRAQAHQASGAGGLEAAIGDYRAALAVFPPETPQAGMTAHGLGTALLEASRRDPAEGPPVADAIAAFERSLGVFGPATHPFQHAVARHSLAMAVQYRAGPGDLGRALDHLEAAVTLFDPRLHRAQWQVAAEALAEVEAALDRLDGRRGRAGHLVRFLAGTSADEREMVLGGRLRRLVGEPPVGQERALAGLASAMVELSPPEHGRVVCSLISVLMKVPDPVLGVACTALVEANATGDDREGRDRVLDEAIHDTLFGPQRVRVRDLLEDAGWVRP